MKIKDVEDVEEHPRQRHARQLDPNVCAQLLEQLNALLTTSDFSFALEDLVELWNASGIECKDRADLESCDSAIKSLASSKDRLAQLADRGADNPHTIDLTLPDVLDAADEYMKAARDAQSALCPNKVSNWDKTNLHSIMSELHPETSLECDEAGDYSIQSVVSDLKLQIQYNVHCAADQSRDKTELNAERIESNASLIESSDSVILTLSVDSKNADALLESIKRGSPLLVNDVPARLTGVDDTRQGKGAGLWTTLITSRGNRRGSMLTEHKAP